MYWYLYNSLYSIHLRHGHGRPCLSGSVVNILVNLEPNRTPLRPLVFAHSDSSVRGAGCLSPATCSWRDTIEASPPERRPPQATMEPSYLMAMKALQVEKTWCTSLCKNISSVYNGQTKKDSEHTNMFTFCSYTIAGWHHIYKPQGLNTPEPSNHPTLHPEMHCVVRSCYTENRHHQAFQNIFIQWANCCFPSSISSSFHF